MVSTGDWVDGAGDTVGDVVGARETVGVGEGGGGTVVTRGVEIAAYTRMRMSRADNDVEIK